MESSPWLSDLKNRLFFNSSLKRWLKRGSSTYWTFFDAFFEGFPRSDVERRVDKVLDRPHDLLDLEELCLELSLKFQNSQKVIEPSEEPGLDVGHLLLERVQLPPETKLERFVQVNPFIVVVGNGQAFQKRLALGNAVKETL